MTVLCHIPRHHVLLSNLRSIIGNSGSDAPKDTKVPHAGQPLQSRLEIDPLNTSTTRAHWQSAQFFSNGKKYIAARSRIVAQANFVFLRDY
jgi:hypothetical protein